MTLTQALSRSREILAANHIEDAHLESELLLRHTLKIDRVELYAGFERELTPGQEKDFEHLIRRRLSGEPTAYITGHREFYGVDFYVDERVLIPRPETELLVEMALVRGRNQNSLTIAEIGTGCGAIAISLALNLPQARIYATDISAPALEVARFNCQRHGVVARVCLLQGDMLAPLPEPVDLIVANLPYVRKSELASGRSFEPWLALDGGLDGLEKIRQLCRGLTGKIKRGGSLLLEIGQGQDEPVASFLRNLFPSAKIKLASDLSGISRIASVDLNFELDTQNS